MKITLRRSLMAVMCLVGMSSVVACGDKEKENEKPLPGVQVENGVFAGTMDYTIGDAELAEGGIVEYTVSESTENGGTITFTDFPVASLIKSIIPDADAADKIIAEIGKVTYTTTYTSTFNAEKTEAIIKLAAQPLSIKSETISVKVTVEIPADGKYKIADKSLNYSIKAIAVTVDNQLMADFKPVTLNFTTVKK